MIRRGQLAHDPSGRDRPRSVPAGAGSLPGDPAAVVSADVVIGSHENIDDLRRAAQGATALTFDHEGVPLEHLRTLEAEGAVRPPSKALHFAQDKLAMRVRLAELGLPVPDFADLRRIRPRGRPDPARRFGDTHDWSVVLKAVRGGYDGREVDTRDGRWRCSTRTSARVLS